MIRAILLIPAPEWRDRLLADGPCGARPPTEQQCGCGQWGHHGCAVLWTPTPHPCETRCWRIGAAAPIGPNGYCEECGQPRPRPTRPRALVLAWDGEAVRQGVDHAAYHLGGRADRTPTVGYASARLRLIWPDGPHSTATEMFPLFALPGFVGEPESLRGADGGMRRAWALATVCASRGLGAVEVVRC